MSCRAQNGTPFRGRRHGVSKEMSDTEQKWKTVYVWRDVSPEPLEPDAYFELTQLQIVLGPCPMTASEIAATFKNSVEEINEWIRTGEMQDNEGVQETLKAHGALSDVQHVVEIMCRYPDDFARCK